MIASAQPVMDARRSRRADTTRREMLTFMAALFSLAILPSSLALKCKCNNEFPLSDCRFQGWTCTVPDSVGACFTRIRLLNGTVRTEYDCIYTNLNPVLCDGVFNSNISVYECCTSGNLCNEHLSPTLPPSSDPTSSSTPTTNAGTSITPSQTISASSSTYSGDPPSSVAVSTSTSSTSGPTPLPGKLRCDCSGSLCHGESSCVTNYKCYQEVHYYEALDSIETRLGCLESIPEVNLNGLLACEGRLDTATKKLKCCDDGDFCNRNLSVVLSTKDPSPPTKDPSKDPSLAIGGLSSSNDSSRSGGDDPLYIILSVVIVVVTVITIAATALIVLTVFFLCYKRDKAKVFSVDHFQNKRHLSAASPYTGKSGLDSPPDYAEHAHV